MDASCDRDAVAATYGRWSLKVALITDAVVYWRDDLESDDAPSAGRLNDGIGAPFEHAPCRGGEVLSNKPILRVTSEVVRKPEQASSLDELMLPRERCSVRDIVRRAEARDEGPAGDDWSLVADVLTEMGLIRVISGQHADANFVRPIVDYLILPAIRAIDE